MLSNSFPDLQSWIVKSVRVASTIPEVIPKYFCAANCSD
jgi:hypothetical protein